MSKLDEVIKNHAYRAKLLDGADPTNVVDREAKSNIRLLIMELFSESLNESESVSDIYHKFMKKLEKL